MLTICHLNDVIVFLEATGNPDIVCLTECRLKEEELKVVKLNKYILTDFYCRSEDIGGVAVVLECYNYKFKQIVVLKISSNFE